ncbi:MAG: 4-hydroxyphenylacetate 3-hydroxylase N-terminal domain-containing protein [Candidatus Bathyarchaeia archaeon]|nr:4-hydroxyphenylacetate 3-hydroxylase N-terminal domain-containing protein [Candidatus Bathyarchaeia archaeon]
MRTSKEYSEKLRKMRKNVYMNGELIERDDQKLLPSIRVLSKTFDLAEEPEFKDLITATSHLTGDTINRFTHVNRSADDLLKKQKIIRKACHLTGGCIQRCMGCDAINALSFVMHEIDKAYGTEYPATLPFEGDFVNPETKKYLEKYIMRKEDVPPEKIHLCFRLLSDMLCSALSGVSAVAGVHGGGSPIMEEITIAATYDFEEKKKIAKYLAGIEKI